MSTFGFERLLRGVIARRVEFPGFLQYVIKTPNVKKLRLLLFCALGEKILMHTLKSRVFALFSHLPPPPPPPFPAPYQHTYFTTTGSALKVKLMKHTDYVRHFNFHHIRIKIFPRIEQRDLPNEM